MKRAFTDSEESQIAKIYLSGHSERAIAKVYPQGRTSISNALRRQGVEKRDSAERNRLYTINPHKFDKIDNELSAYWLGFLFADGNVSKRSLSVTLKRNDFEHLQKLLDFFESNAPIHFRTSWIGKKEYKNASIDITHSHLSEKLKSIGLLPRRPNPNDIIMATEPSQYNHLIRGFWDGDGYCSRNPNEGIGFCGKKIFLEFIQKTIVDNSYLDLTRKLSKHPKSDIYYLRYSGRKVAFAAFSYMFRNATIWLPRKYNTLRNWPEPQERIRDSKGRFL